MNQVITYSYHNPLFDIFGDIIIRTDEHITPARIKKIAGIKNSSPLCAQLTMADITEDIRSAINRAVYKNFFSPRHTQRQILKIINQTKLPGPILQELTRIKNQFPNLYAHIIVVTALCLRVGLEMGKNNYDPVHTSEIGLTHDLGKSRLPAEILEKKDPLTQEEFRVIKLHPLIDYLLLTRYFHDASSLVARASFSHHERPDGSGYPRGIRRLPAKIQALIPCDMFDALISRRPYRSEPYSTRAALDLLLEESMKGKINRKFVFCLINCARKQKSDYRTLRISRPGRDPAPAVNYYGIRAD